VRLGAYRESACAQTGTSSRTLRKWLMRAELDIARGRLDSPYVVFAEALEQAEAEAENRNLGTLQMAAKGDWRAAAWWLERKHWKRWGDAKTRHEIDAMVTTLLDEFEREFADEPEVLERILLAAARATSGEQRSAGSAGARAADDAGGSGGEPPQTH
jgi:hypothetical protein